MPSATASPVFAIDVYDSNVYRTTRFGLYADAGTIREFVSAPYNPATSAFDPNSPTKIVELGSPVSPNTFASFDALLDYTTKTLSLTIDGTNYGTAIPFVEPTSVDLAAATLEIGTFDAATDSGYFDNYLVSTLTVGTWLGTSGSYGSSANWTNAATVGVPGLAGVNAHDTATFCGSGSVTSIDLTGVNPNLRGLSFSNSSYTLSGGSLTLQSSDGMRDVERRRHGRYRHARSRWPPGPAVISVLTPPSVLTVSGNIGETGGSQVLVLNGPGELVLSGSNLYTGGTIVSDGTLIVTTPAGLPSGQALTIGDADAFAAAGCAGCIGRGPDFRSAGAGHDDTADRRIRRNCGRPAIERIDSILPARPRRRRTG